MKQVLVSLALVGLLFTASATAAGGEKQKELTNKAKTNTYVLGISGMT